MSNTKIRIISALAMLLICIASLLVGKMGLILLLGIAGLLIIDEISCNMVKVKRISLGYILSQVSFLINYVYINFSVEYSLISNYIIAAGFVLNIILLAYLFIVKMESKSVVYLFKRFDFMVGFFVLIPLLSLSWIAQQENWLVLISLIFILNFSVDTGAWFFGRHFGKKKLWPTVSPKKTINGALGGVFTALILSLIFLLAFSVSITPLVVFGLILLGASAQVGDLIQSKLKRQFDIKDSSNLIPGHGGMYDRIDSLVFVSPFFIYWASVIF